VGAAIVTKDSCAARYNLSINSKGLSIFSRYSLIPGTHRWSRKDGNIPRTTAVAGGTVANKAVASKM
jgi:hypothetical protein